MCTKIELLEGECGHWSNRNLGGGESVSLSFTSLSWSTKFELTPSLPQYLYCQSKIGPRLDLRLDAKYFIQKQTADNIATVFSTFHWDFQRACYSRGFNACLELVVGMLKTQ